LGEYEILLTLLQFFLVVAGAAAGGQPPAAFLTSGRWVMSWTKWMGLLSLGKAIEKMEAEIKGATVGQNLASGEVLELRVFGRRLGVGLALKVKA